MQNIFLKDRRCQLVDVQGRWLELWMIITRVFRWLLTVQFVGLPLLPPHHQAQTASMHTPTVPPLLSPFCLPRSFHKASDLAQSKTQSSRPGSFSRASDLVQFEAQGSGPRWTEVWLRQGALLKTSNGLLLGTGGKGLMALTLVPGVHWVCLQGREPKSFVGWEPKSGHLHKCCNS